jgi:hypothetical protein
MAEYHGGDQQSKNLFTWLAGDNQGTITIDHAVISTGFLSTDIGTLRRKLFLLGKVIPKVASWRDRNPTVDELGDEHLKFIAVCSPGDLFQAVFGLMDHSGQLVVVVGQVVACNTEMRQRVYDKAFAELLAVRAQIVHVLEQERRRIDEALNALD